MERDNIIIEHKHKNLLRMRSIAALVLTVLFSSLSICAIVLLFRHPLEQPRAANYMILFVLLMLAIFFGLGVLRYFTNFINRSWGFYIFQILTALMLPFLIISKLENSIQERILALVKSELVPTITSIEAYWDQYGYLPKNITKVANKPHFLNNMTYACSKNIFVLETDVPSIDIDEAKIFYNSKEKQWYEFHNDEYQYYQNKKERPKRIENYISFHSQADLTVSVFKKKNGMWDNFKYETFTPDYSRTSNDITLSTQKE